MRKVIGKILFNLIIVTAIIGMAPVDSLESETLKSIVEGIKSGSSAATLILAVALNEERRNKNALIKHLEGMIEFTKKNMDWFQSEHKRIRELYYEKNKYIKIEDKWYEKKKENGSKEEEDK